MSRTRDSAEDALEVLRQAVAEALERKRRLGQYAVTWRNGRIEFIGPNPPPATGYDNGQANMPPGISEPENHD